MEVVFRNQQLIYEKIVKLYSNFKKDSAGRKSSAEYFNSRLTTLEEHWNEYQRNHQELISSEESLSHPYFRDLEHEETRKYYSKALKDINTQYQQWRESLRKPGDLPPGTSTQQQTAEREDSGELETKKQQITKRQQKESGGYSKIDDMMHKQQINFMAFRRTVKHISVEEIAEKWELEDALKSLQTRWSTIDALHWDIEGEIDGENSEYDNDFNEHEATYNILKKRINSKIWSVAHREKSTPQLEIPTFFGNYNQWVSFKDLFNEAIHSNPTLSRAQKMQFLKGKVRGEAEKLIQHLQISSDNYTVCWEILNNRYNNKKLIFTSHINVLLGLPNIQQQSLGQLKKMHDTTLECLHAISNLGVDISTWDPLLVHILANKLDSESYSEYLESLKNSRELPALQEFLDYLESKFTILESARKKSENTNINSTYKSGQPNASTYNNKRSYQQNIRTINNRPNMNNSVSKTYHVSKFTCPLCNNEHGIYNCKSFLEMPNEMKLNTINNLHICYNCLFSHNGNKCISTKRCRICGQQHNTKIHAALCESPTNSQFMTPSTSGLKPNFNRKNEHVNTTSHDMPSSQNWEILLATAHVKVTTRDGTNIILRALIDQGSQLSLITEHAVQLLGLKREKCQGVVLGVGQKENNSKGMVKLTCASIYNNFEFSVNALIMNNLIKNLPNTTVSRPTWSYIQNIALADPTFYESRPVDILLGADIYSLIVLEGIIKGNSLSQPTAQQSQLGWLLCGSMQTYQCNVVLNNVEELHKFWELEEISEESKLSEQDQYCIDFYNTTTTRSQDGSYQVRLPLKEDISTKLGTSKQIATAQFINLERKFQKQTKLAEEYKNFMTEYQLLKHMIPEQEFSSKLQCYLPHHAVERAESTTTKLRVVFNASCKTSSGYSLNDSMYTGPNLQRDLQTLIIKWRQYQYAFTSDIEKMYRKISLNEQDQQLQKIIWRDTNQNNLQTYQLTTVTYGTRSAPFLAMMTLKRLAEDEREKYPEAAKILEESFFMDDLIHGPHTIEHAKFLTQQLYNLLKAGGFTLRKWTTNRQEVLENIEHEQNIEQIFNFKIENTSKTLGIGWNPADDTLSIKYNISNTELYPTKRILLAEISKLYDPLGWIAPITTKLKILFQKLWKMNIIWDERVPNEINSEWCKIKAELNNINNYKIPRWIQCQENDVIELHGFCDASIHAYGCVIYSRVLNNNDWNITLQAAKTKLVPANKTLTLPRLELSGAHLLSKLMNKVETSLSSHKLTRYGWCDSMVVLGWLQGEASRWKPFVANRVKQVTNIMPAESWRYVASSENPADAASRGLFASQLTNHRLWWQGPKWLSTFDSKLQQKQIYNTTEEVKITLTNVVQSCTEPNNIIETLLCKYSSFAKIRRIVAWILRMCVPKHKRKQTPPYLTLNELRQAKYKIINHVQKIEFATDMEHLIKYNKVHVKSKLLNLNPFIDEQGTLRVGGRLKHSQLSTEMKHPAIIPHENRLTTLLIEEAHFLTFHGGPRVTLANLRQNFWIIGGNNATKKHIRRCVTCRKYDSRKQHQLMGTLPEARSNRASPFYHTGVDYSGFVEVKANKGRGVKTTKGYIALFVCMVTKAIHLELVSDLTTSAFLAALRRMSARRGAPRHLYCDNGTNFKGASRMLREELYEIQQMLQNNNIVTDIAELNIEWHWNAPSWPSAGGLWERGMRSLKHHLKRVIGENKLTYEEYITILTQIEACLNSRPLCALSEDIDDLDILTPAHFLTGRSGLTVIQTTEDARTRWHLTRKIFLDLWKRWSNEYLTQQTVRNKWQLPQPNLQIGDMVMIQDDNMLAGKWPVGRVTELHPGADGHVRVVTLKTKNGYLKRPVVKLAVLPIRSEKNSVTTSNQVTNITVQNKRTKTYKQPRLYSIAMALIFFMTLVSPSFGAFNIATLKNDQNMYFDPLAKMHLVKDKWKMIVYFNMDPYWEGVSAYSKLTNYLEKSCNTLNIKNHCNMIILQQSYEYAELTYYDSLLLSQHFSGRARQRRRRGLINGVGYLANTLFGVLDERFAEKYAEDIKQIKQNQDHVIKLWKNQTSIIESEYNLLKRMKGIMEKQHTSINKHLNSLDNSLNVARIEMNEMSKIQEFTLSAMTSYSLLQSLKQIQESILDTITNIYNGQISFHLLSPEQLKQELNIISGQLSEDETLPVENFNEDLTTIYKLLKVRTRITKQYLLFEITIPLISRDSYKLYEIIPIPHKFNNNMITILPVSNHIAINLKRDSYLTLSNEELTLCFKQDSNLLCEFRSPIYHFNGKNDICLHNQNICELKNNTCRNQWKPLNDLSTYLYFCCHTYKIKVICDDHISSTELNGAGIISLGENCMIKGNDFTLYAHQQKQNSLQINASLYVPQVKMDSINHILQMNLTQFNKYNERNRDSKELNHELENIHKRIETIKQEDVADLSFHNVHHYAAIYVLVAVVAAISGVLLWRWWRGKQRRREPDTPHLELQSRAESVTGVSARIQVNPAVCRESRECSVKDNDSVHALRDYVADRRQCSDSVYKQTISVNKSCSPIPKRKTQY